MSRGLICFPEGDIRRLACGCVAFLFLLAAAVGYFVLHRIFGIELNFPLDGNADGLIVCLVVFGSGCVIYGALDERCFLRGHRTLCMVLAALVACLSGLLLFAFPPFLLVLCRLMPPETLYFCRPIPGQEGAKKNLFSLMEVASLLVMVVCYVMAAATFSSAGYDEMGGLRNVCVYGFFFVSVFFLLLAVRKNFAVPRARRFLSGLYKLLLANSCWLVLLTVVFELVRYF